MRIIASGASEAEAAAAIAAVERFMREAWAGSQSAQQRTATQPPWKTAALQEGVESFNFYK